MDIADFKDNKLGSLVPIHGTDPTSGPWQHSAFVPTPPSAQEPPTLSHQTHRAVAEARAALAALDATSRQLPNPQLLRRPTLRREAQSTSALEGTFAPLSDVLAAADDQPSGTDMREILNYERMASQAFHYVGQGASLTTGLLCDLQGVLVKGTSAEGSETGRIRRVQVAVGQREGAAPSELRVRAARFVPPPPGLDLDASVGDFVDWFRTDHAETLDPVVAAAMAHYQFETLHPFHDGNGRLGRMLIVLHLHLHGILSEPTLTVSPWFESRRTEYYNRLLHVSRTGVWDEYIQFFATGIRASADLTYRQMLALVAAQETLKERVRASALRADTAHVLVDFAVANPTFTIRQVEEALGVSYGRANKLVQQLVDLGVLREMMYIGGTRRFSAPDILEVLISTE
ncbi:Fic family protein [Zhihengliuella halotolerans]|uniref:Fic family protein n=1 Tax=Zhihengliuella halotolerans TaxID=370736 RepID=UPI000C80C195|nr:Fic/DOC family N-terminal domain-containing protein [Zhihengliuella halotolerans]